jgi:hypothetical protein
MIREWMMMKRVCYDKVSTETIGEQVVKAKNLTIISVIITFIILLAGGFTQKLGCADWKWIGTDSDSCMWYVDTKDMRQLPESRTLVWVKRIVTEDQRHKAVEARVKRKLPVDGYDRWGYELGLMEVNCVLATLRQRSISDYDTDGKYLKARKVEENITPVTRDSMGELIYRQVCSPPETDPGKIAPRFPSPWDDRR